MRYLVVVEQGPTSFGAYVPDLPGCVAAGESKAGSSTDPRGDRAAHRPQERRPRGAPADLGQRSGRGRSRVAPPRPRGPASGSSHPRKAPPPWPLVLPTTVPRQRPAPLLSAVQSRRRSRQGRGVILTRLIDHSHQAMALSLRVWQGSIHLPTFQRRLIARILNAEQISRLSMSQGHISSFLIFIRRRPIRALRTNAIRRQRPPHPQFDDSLLQLAPSARPMEPL